MPSSFSESIPLSASIQRVPLALCINELDRGGAEKALVRIACGLQALGWPVTVISLRERGPLAEPLEAAGIPVHALECRGMADLRTLGRLKHRLRQIKPAVLLTFLHQAGFWGRLAARGARVGITVCGIRVADRRHWVRWTDRLTRSRVDHYIAVSEHVARTHAKLCGIPPDRISSIPNGIDCGNESSLQDRREPARILFLGRLTRQKDPLTLLQAWRSMPDKLRNASELHFVGHGDLSAKLRAAITAEEQDRICFHGHQPDVTEFLQQSTMLVLPSLWEGMPNAVLEAMAAKLPVIATQVDGTQELIPDSRFGWLVPPGDVKSLSAAMTEALRNPQERISRAAAALERVQTEFSWEQVVQQYDQQLSQLISPKRANSELSDDRNDL